MLRRACKSLTSRLAACRCALSFKIRGSLSFFAASGSLT